MNVGPMGNGVSRKANEIAINPLNGFAWFLRMMVSVCCLEML